MKTGIHPATVAISSPLMSVESQLLPYTWNCLRMFYLHCWSIRVFKKPILFSLGSSEILHCYFTHNQYLMLILITYILFKNLKFIQWLKLPYYVNIWTFMSIYRIYGDISRWIHQYTNMSKITTMLFLTNNFFSN